jgi:hypothetical protein
VYSPFHARMQRVLDYKRLLYIYYLSYVPHMHIVHIVFITRAYQIFTNSTMWILKNFYTPTMYPKIRKSINNVYVFCLCSSVAIIHSHLAQDWFLVTWFRLVVCNVCYVCGFLGINDFRGDRKR